MITLGEAIAKAGYTVCYSPSWSCAEIEGEGDWHGLLRDAYHICKHSDFDCIQIVVRSPDGHRRAYDVGMAGVQTFEFPPVLPHRPMCQISQSGYIGVKSRLSRIRGIRWLAEVGYRGYYHYVGMFDTALEAAQARDAFILSHHVKRATLNFPQEESHG